MSGSQPDRVAAFHAVREFPYATNAGHDMASLRRLGRGNCVAKAEAMRHELSLLAFPARLVRWEYRIPDVVDDARTRGFSRDIHTACQVWIAGRWILVDATHDPPLRTLGLTVGVWDGSESTEPAYLPTGPTLIVGHRDDDERARQLTVAIAAEMQSAGTDRVTAHRDHFNLHLDRARQQ